MIAYSVRSTLLFRPIFIMGPRCVLIVLTDTKNSSAICETLSPSASFLKTSNSRVDSFSCGDCSVSVTYASASCCSSDGLTYWSPFSTRRAARRIFADELPFVM